MSYLVSVIIPVYNSEKHLERCLESLMRQTLKDIQFIVVNDGSTDQSQQILEKYANTYSHIEVIQQVNQGAAGARNTGLDYVKAPYVGFVDADDTIEDKMFEKLYQAIVDGQAQLSVCSYITYKGITRFKSTVDSITSMNRGEMYIKYIGKSPVLWNKLFEYEIVKSLKFDQRMKMGEDLLFNTLAYQELKRIAAVEDVLYNYDDHPSSITHQRGLCDYRDMITSYCEDIETVDEVVSVYQMLIFITGFLFSTVMNRRTYTYVYKVFSQLIENNKYEVVAFLKDNQYKSIYRYDAVSRKIYYAYKVIFFFDYMRLRSVAAGLMWVLSKLIRIR